MPYSMYKVKKSSRIRVIVDGTPVVMHYGTFMCHPVDHRDSGDHFVDAVYRGWGASRETTENVSDWNGYIVRSKRAGSPVYSKVRFDPIFGEDQKPGFTSAYLIGFLKKDGRSWTVVPEFENDYCRAVAKDGKYYEVFPDRPDVFHERN